jgi:hypothetical protein
MSEQNDQVKLNTQDEGMIARFRAKAKEFVDAWNTLATIENVPPNLQAEYADLQERGGVIQWSLTGLTQTVDTVTGFVSDVFNFDGVSATRDYINGRDTTLGIAPLIPIAAITGALAVMGKFITDVYLFERKVNEQKRLVAGGMPETDAADVVKRMTGQGITANLAEMAKPIAFALGAFVLLRMLRS